MQVSSTIVIVAAELYVALLIGSIILFVYARKLKALTKKQHSKLLSLVAELKNSTRDVLPSGIDPAEHERQLEACKKTAESAAAATISEKDALIQDLQEQLQLKAGASEESETSVQILKEELLKAQEELNTVQEELTGKEQALLEQAQLAEQKEEESQSSTESLANLTLEHQELTAKLMQLENENSELKQVIADTPILSHNTLASETGDSEEKDQLISELQEQLQRQIRSTQEAETCVQVLSKEILRGKEAIAREEKMLATHDLLNEQNQELKSTLKDLSEEAQDLLSRLNGLQSENAELKQAINKAEADNQNNQEREAFILQLQQQAEVAETQREEAKTHASELETRVQLLDKELASTQQELITQGQALAEQASITAENQQLKQALAALEGEVSELKQVNRQLPPIVTDADHQEQQALVQRLQEQLEQQTLSTQESEACVQTLSKELFDLRKNLASLEKVIKDQEKVLKKQLMISKEAKTLETQQLEAQRLENQGLKQTLEKLSQENQALIEKLKHEEALRQEALRQEALRQENQAQTSWQDEESEEVASTQHHGEELVTRLTQNQENQALMARLHRENEELIAKLNQEKHELIATLHQESEELKARLDLLEAENTALKRDGGDISSAANDTLKFKKLQAQYKDLQDDYAQLEEKYTELTNL